MGQHPAAQPAQRQDHHLAARHLSMGALELRDGGGRERLDRGFGDAAIAPARLQRIAAPDALRAQGEAAVVHPLAPPVEQRRSEERRVGEEYGRTGNTRWWPYHQKKKQAKAK